MRFTVTDSLGRLVDLNGIDWYISLLLRSKGGGNPSVLRLQFSINIKAK